MPEKKTTAELSKAAFDSSGLPLFCTKLGLQFFVPASSVGSIPCLGC